MNEKRRREVSGYEHGIVGGDRLEVRTIKDDGRSESALRIRLVVHVHI
jgi:hypothetical protein